jgi:hypothetical protein
MTIGHDDTKRKPDCVVIDTNIWRSDLLLKTPMGQSLVYALQRQGGRIGLPEVIEAELIGQVVECGLEAAKKFAESSRIINALTDPPFPATVPTRPDLEKKVNERLTELTPILHRVPFTFEHAKAALNMVIAKLPPNGLGDQQFKDSAMWQAVLTLSRDYNARLVSNDRAFLLDRGDPSKGFAPNLLEDCQRVGATITVHCDLASCLKAITGSAPSIDQARLVSLITDSVTPRLRAEAARHRSRIIEPSDIKTQVFRTAKTSHLAVDYLITARCASVVTDDRIDCLTIARGSCYYDPEANSIFGEFLWSLEFEWRHPSGGTCRFGSGFGSVDPWFLFPPPATWAWGNSVDAARFGRTDERCQK